MSTLSQLKKECKLEGRLIGYLEGRFETQLKIIKNLLAETGMSIRQIAERLNITLEHLEDILLCKSTH